MNLKKIAESYAAGAAGGAKPEAADDDVPDLVAKGRDLEKIVLATAVRWHLENRILVYENKTVVFD